MLNSVWGILEVLIAPSIAVLVSALVVVAMRRTVLWRRGRSPRVQITQFGWASSGSDERQAIWITSQFRGHLTSLKLDPLDAVPDRAPGAPLVEIVEGVGQGVTHGLDAGRAIGRLWRAAVPDSAYEVWATLRPQGDEGGLISVQLIERAGGNRTLVNFTSTGPSWDSSAREAAMAVAGALYPHVANHYKGPWTRWRDAVPAQVIDLYQSALEAESANRPEQALGAFRAALRKDPLNPHLRLKIAMLEERLNLHLDAWFTYLAIVGEANRDLWKGPDRRIRLLALYRLAIHLWNPKVAEQWVELRGAEGSQDRHHSALEQLRVALIVALEEDVLFIGEAKARLFWAAVAPAPDLIDALVSARSHRRSELLASFGPGGEIDEIRQLLQIVSLRYLEELEGRMRAWPGTSVARWRNWRAHRPPLTRWLPRREFSRMTIEVSERLVRLHIASSAHSLLAAKGRTGALARLQAEGERLVTRWPFPPDGRLRRAGRVVHPRLWWTNKREDAWQLHYNAACTISSALLEGSIVLRAPSFDLKRYAVAVTRQLEEYAHKANSRRVAGKADWLVFEDPDLDTVVHVPEFRLWASRHLAFEFPDELHRSTVDTERYVALIVRRAAGAFAVTWRGRAAMDRAATGTLIGWWREEQQIWERLATLCCEHRSWRHRLEALKGLERWSTANGLPPVDLAYEDRDGTEARAEIPSGMFAALKSAIEGEPGGPLTVLPWAKRHAKEIQEDCDERLMLGAPNRFAPLSKDERTMAVKAAQIWSLLAQAVEAGLSDQRGESTVLAREQAWRTPLNQIAGKLPAP